MMDWTDRHCRTFHRVLSPSVWLYTEILRLLSYANRN